MIVFAVHVFNLREYYVFSLMSVVHVVFANDERGHDSTLNISEHKIE